MKKIQELMGKNAASFATSVMQIVNSNELLKNATPESVFNAACMAATLNLPINVGLAVTTGLGAATGTRAVITIAAKDGLTIAAKSNG